MPATPNAVETEPGAASPSVSSAALRRLRDLLYDKCGLYIGEEEEEDLRRTLAAGPAAADKGDCQAWLDQLEDETLPPQELGRLLRRLLPPDTALAGDLQELRAFRESFQSHLAERAIARGEPAVRLWSVGAGGGLDPYRLGLLLAAWRKPRPPGLPVRITASDADLTTLHAARERIYRSEDLAGLPDGPASSGFEEFADGWRMGSWVERTVQLETIDLADPAGIAGLGVFDAIFARHVLCRRMPAQRQALLDAFESRLHSGGLLFLGRGESPGSARTSLRLILYPGGAVYRKPLRR